MEIKNLTLSFGVQTIFDNISLFIEKNSHVGIVGVNGAGKTTFLKVILGKITPDSGKISLSSNNVSFLPQVIKDEIPSLNIDVFSYLIDARPIEKISNEISSLYEKIGTSSKEEYNNIYKKIERLENKLKYYEYESAESTLLKIIDGMDISSDILDKKLIELSGGEKSKVAFAKLLYSKSDIILLDEPTNHLDYHTKEFVIKFLKKYKGSMFVISHDIDFLNKVTNKTLFLDKNTKKMEIYNGNYAYFKKVYEDRKEALLRKEKNEQKEIDKLTKVVEKYSHSSGNRKRMAQDREKKLEKLLKKHTQVIENKKHVKIDISLKNEGSSVPLKIENLYFKYDNSNDYIIKDLSFTLENGEKFLVVGKNGAGKSTLLKLIVGVLSKESGCINLGKKTEISYYAQEHESLDNDRTILENVKNSNYTNKELRAFLGRFLFFEDDVFKKVSVLSPGERSRVALAKLALSGANFLILDEPTNHLDVETQKIISKTFMEYKGTILIVSHNSEFVSNLGISRILTLPGGNIRFYDKEIVDYYKELNNKEKNN